ncbi:MAG: sigma-70 family RNA polymerase sigma factor [Planctomycetota bacterium]
MTVLDTPSRTDLDRLDLGLLRTRDPIALGQLFDHYFPLIHGRVLRLVKDPHAAEDLVQEIFLHVFRALPSYDPSRPLAPWMFTITMNKVRDHWRDRRSRAAAQPLPSEEESLDPALVSCEGSPGAEMESSELARQIEAAVADLPASMRTTFQLRSTDGMRYAEMERVVGQKETALRKQYSRALGVLRRELAGTTEA